MRDKEQDIRGEQGYAFHQADYETQAANLEELFHLMLEETQLKKYCMDDIVYEEEPFDLSEEEIIGDSANEESDFEVAEEEEEEKIP